MVLAPFRTDVVPTRHLARRHRLRVTQGVPDAHLKLCLKPAISEKRCPGRSPNGRRETA